MRPLRFLRALPTAMAVLLTALAPPPPATALTPLDRLAEENRVLTEAGVRIHRQSDAPTLGDVAVGPGRITLELAPGQSETVEVQIDSTSPGLRSFSFETEDFGVAEDGSDATKLYGTVAGPHSAREWLRPAVPVVRLQFGERAQVPVTVTVPRNAEPGDRYAALLVRRAPQPGESDARGFSIVSRVGTLFLITVTGDIRRDADTVSLTSRKRLYWFLPAYLGLEVANNGTVHAAPSGVIRMTNIFGSPAGEIPVRDWYVLRQSVRTRVFPWEPGFAMGRYTATANLTVYGGEMAQVSTSFWVIPLLPLLIALLLLLITVFLVRRLRGKRTQGELQPGTSPRQ